MSTVMNNKVKIILKSVMTQVFTVVDLLVEISTYIANPKVYPKADL